MVVVVVILAVIAIALIVIGVWGRVVATGVFCRRCRFDLAGLDQPDTCPECGRSVVKPRSRIRARRRGVIAAAILVLLVAGAIWSTQAAPVRAWLLPRMSDRALLLALDLGMEGTDTEIENRLMDPTKPREHLVPLVERSLASVLDKRSEAPLDLQRYLVAALAGTQLTPDQLQRYVDATFRIELHMRGTAAFNHREVPVAAYFVQVGGMFDPSAPSLGQPGYTAVVALDRSGSDDPAQQFSSKKWSEHAKMDQQVRLSGGSMGWSAGMNAPIIETADGPVGVAAARVRVFDPMKPGITAERISTIRRPIEFVPPHQLGADVADDPALTSCFAEAISIDSITLSHDPSTDATTDDSVRLWMQFRSLPTCGLSGCFRVRITTGEGEPIWLTGSTTMDATPDDKTERYMISGSWSVPPTIADRIAAAETVDLLLVPDPAGAYDSARLELITGEGLRFRSLPVIVSEQAGFQAAPRGMTGWVHPERVKPDELPGLPAE